MQVWINHMKQVSAHKTVFAIALPMILSNIAAPLLGLVDTAIIGHLPESKYLTAVAIGAMVVSMLYLMAMFLRMSTTGLIAQAYGANNKEQLQSTFYDASIFALVIGVGIILLIPMVLPVMWWVLEADLEIQALTNRYVSIRLFSAPAALFTLVGFGVLIGLQKAKQAMWLAIITNVLNLAGNLILIIGLKLDVTGAAISSLIAEWVTAWVTLKLVIQALGLSWRQRPTLDTERLKKLFILNQDIFIRSLLLHACMAAVTVRASYEGDVIVAANAVLLQFLTLISLGLDGIAYAVEALVGEAKGKRDSRQAHQWFYLCLFWSCFFAVGYSLIFWLWGERGIALMTDLPDVIEAATQYLGWVVLLPLLAHWSYLFDGLFIGLSESALMRNTMAIAALVFYVPSLWLTLSWGNDGLWFALCCFMFGRGVGQVYFIWKKRLLYVHLETA